jgi:putative transposase
MTIRLLRLQFKTMKYVPDFYRMHTPASVYFGTAEQIRVQRQLTLDRAYARFTRRSRPPRLPEVAWINQLIEQKQPAQ